MKTISIVTSCYNEEHNIPEFYTRIKEVMTQFPDYLCEFIVADNCSTDNTRSVLRALAEARNVRTVFAYNARFDFHHLPELGAFEWCDIMALAAYRQHNPAIPPTAPLCSTGRLKRGFGVESVLRLLSGDHTYRETHNALQDALDELRIMALLGHKADKYSPINK